MKDLSKNKKLQDKRRWESGWEEHEALQHNRVSRLPLSGKILWMEEAHRMVRSLQSSRSSLANPENHRKD